MTVIYSTATFTRSIDTTVCMRGHRLPGKSNHGGFGGVKPRGWTALAVTIAKMTRASCRRSPPRRRTALGVE
jgi:hypothetical protein